MKGQSWQIEEMLKLFLVVVVFAGTILIIIGITGGLTEVLTAFCRANPSWCGEESYPPCVCCGVRTITNPYHDFWVDDHIEWINYWNTEIQCKLDIQDSDWSGTIWEGADEERCGVTGSVVLGKGFRGLFIKGGDCEVPERFQEDSGYVPSCVCCAITETNKDGGSMTMYGWYTSYDCRDFGQGNYSYVNETICGYLWMMPRETREDTINRLYAFYDVNQLYPQCQIPYPFNMTTRP